jgi:hypothetical protein
MASQGLGEFLGALVMQGDLDFDGTMSVDDDPGRVGGVTYREILDELAEKLQSKLSFTVIGRIPFSRRFSAADGTGCR